MSHAVIAVKIEFDPDTNSVRSSHQPLSGVDGSNLEKWPSGGLVQISHALFVEALKRESYTMAISLLSTGTCLEDLTATVIEQKTRLHLLEMVNRFALGAAQEALEMITPQT